MSTSQGRARWHPDVARVVDKLAAGGVPTYDQVGVLGARALADKVVQMQLPQIPVALIHDVLVPGPAGLLPLRVYHPDPKQRLPVVLYLHGGGWILGGVTTTDGPCRRLAVSSGCVVVALEYRLAPETKFPGPLDDCVAAVRWLAANHDVIGGDGRMSLLGDSAGGNLAAATSLCLRDDGGPQPDAQILIYPCLARRHDRRYPSYQAQAEGPLLTRAEMEWFWELYLRSEADGVDPRAAPLEANDLSRLPPTTVVVCELDLLRDEGVAYAGRLREAGVPVDLIEFPGAAHGFWWMDALMGQATELTTALGPVLRGEPAVSSDSGSDRALG